MMEPKIAATLVSLKTVQSMNPELHFAKDTYTPEQYGDFIRELRRLFNRALDFHEFDLTSEEVLNLVRQENGSIH